MLDSLRPCLSTSRYWLFQSSQRYLSTSDIKRERLRVQAIPLRGRKAPKGWNDNPLNRKGRRNFGAFQDWKRVRVKAGDGGDGGIHMVSLTKTEVCNKV